MITSAEEYTPVPNEQEFLAAFQPDPRHARSNFPNVVSLSSPHDPSKSLWPVIFIKREDLFCAALPLLEYPSYSGGDIDLIDLPCVTTTLSVLEDLSIYALRYSPTYSAFQLADVNMLLSVALPLGSPVDTEISRLGAIVTSGFGSGPLAHRRPAWKPYFYRGQQQIRVLMREKICCSQYDRQDIVNVGSVSGVINVEAALEGLPDVTLVLSQSKERDRHIPLAALALHQCATASGDVLSSKKITFSPPLEPFQLCHYSCQPAAAHLPVRGFYQLKSISETEVRLLLQLKLISGTSNEFDYFDVHLPFPTRGRILSADRAPTAGSVSVTKDGQGLLWKVGTRFSTANLEVALPATVQFDAAEGAAPEESSDRDVFCVGDTAYAKIMFKLNSHNVSGLSVGQEGVTIVPKGNVQVVVERSLEADDYVIWNSSGEVRHALQPPEMEAVEAPTASAPIPERRKLQRHTFATTNF